MDSYNGYAITKVRDGVYEVPKQRQMRVPARIYATQTLFETICEDKAIEQAINVATLPGIVGHSLAMPDMHWGYGFPIGGVAAFDLEDGVISPGGVGYDINCGVRLMASKLTRQDIEPSLERVVNAMYKHIPTGIGKDGKVRVDSKDMRKVFTKGAQWAVKKGFGTESDLAFIEEGGRISHADPSQVSKRALERGRGQLGTLGSGNHFAEIGYVDRVFDEQRAQRLGLALDTVCVIIHTGSRGCGYQICDDTLRVLQKASKRYGIDLPDRQLAAAPIQSPEGQAYLGAMRCAVNYAFANRQVIGHWVREAFHQALDMRAVDIGLRVVYEVAHNIAKFETHTVDGKERELCVHRKGATRAFGPGHADVPDVYRDIGQPVLIPGDMGRYSFVLTGTETAMDETWGSSCHGAGRCKSRAAAKRAARGRDLQAELREAGVTVRAASHRTIAEEMPDAYKDVAEVVRAVEQAGISKIVCRLKPMGCIKG